MRCFNLFFDCSRGGGAPIHRFITNFFYCRGGRGAPSFFHQIFCRVKEEGGGG